MKKILITNKIIPDYLKLFDEKKYFLVIKESMTAIELKEESSDAHAIISMLSDQIDQELIENSPMLKIIAQYAVGTNNINLKACKDHGVIVTNTPNVLSHATAEIAFALTLACARKLMAAHNNVRNLEWKGWEPMGFLGKSLKKIELGIIGPGKIGHEYARMCKGAFDMNVSYYSRSQNMKFESELNATRKDLNQLLRDSDLISLHCPLTSETNGLIGDGQLSTMKEDSILINTARGEVIDQNSLEKYLSLGKFHGVGLDVTTPEPLPSQSTLRTYDRVIITPHIASATTKARGEMAELVCRSVIDALEERLPKNTVTI